MAAPTAVVAARFAWVGYRDRIPFLNRRGDGSVAPEPSDDVAAVGEPELVDAGAPLP